MKTHFAVAIVDADRNMSEWQIQKSERGKLAQAPHRTAAVKTKHLRRRGNGNLRARPCMHPSLPAIGPARIVSTGQVKIRIPVLYTTTRMEW